MPGIPCMLGSGFPSITNSDALNQTTRGLLLKTPCPQVSWQCLTLHWRNERLIRWITQPCSCVHMEIIHLNEISFVNSSKDELQKQLLLKFCKGGSRWQLQSSRLAMQPTGLSCTQLLLQPQQPAVGSTGSTWGLGTLRNGQALAALKAERSKVTSQVTVLHHCLSVLHRALSELQQTADNFVQTEVLCGLAVHQELAAISGPALREQRGSLISPSKPSYPSLSIFLQACLSSRLTTTLPQ